MLRLARATLSKPRESTLARALLLSPGMRFSLAAALALVLFSAVPRAAQACGQGRSGGSGNVVFYSTLLSVSLYDLAFTVHDVGFGKSTRVQGVAETLVMAPQVILGVAALATLSNADGRTLRTPLTLYTAWVGALLVHGIYAMVRANDGGGEAAPERVQPGAPPAPPEHSRAGLGMTFVDVGQRSAPGLGIVGSF